MLKKLKKKKDAIISSGLKSYANSKLDGIGEILKLELNTRQRSVRARVAICGDCRPLDVALDHYQIIQRGGRYLVRVAGVQTSEKQLTNQLNEYLQREDLVLPRNLAPMMKALA